MPKKTRDTGQETRDRGVKARASKRVRPTPERAAEIYRRLHEHYPNAHCALDFKTPFQLLVATILSAQCTDKRVNMVTPVLFERYPTPAALAAAQTTRRRTEVTAAVYRGARACAPGSGFDCNGPSPYEARVLAALLSALAGFSWSIERWVRAANTRRDQRGIVGGDKHSGRNPLRWQRFQRTTCRRVTEPQRKNNSPGSSPGLLFFLCGSASLWQVVLCYLCNLIPGLRR